MTGKRPRSPLGQPGARHGARLLLSNERRSSIAQAAVALAETPAPARPDVCVSAARELIGAVGCEIWIREDDAPAKPIASVTTTDDTRTTRATAASAAWLVNELEHRETSQVSGMVGHGSRAAFIAPAKAAPPHGRRGTSTALVVEGLPGAALDDTAILSLQLVALEMLPLLDLGQRHYLSHLPVKDAEVLALLAAGCGVSDIATHLEEGLNAVGRRIKTLHRRLGVQSRAELLHIRAVRQEFCPPWIKLAEDPRATLSERQQQILEQLVCGRSEKEIAAELGVSPHTVHDSVKLIHRQFGVRNRSELLSLVLGEEALRQPSRRTG